MLFSLTWRELEKGINSHAYLIADGFHETSQGWSENVPPFLAASLKIWASALLTAYLSLALELKVWD